MKMYGNRKQCDSRKRHDDGPCRHPLNQRPFALITQFCHPDAM
jgi:hypothetical protein